MGLKKFWIAGVHGLSTTGSWCSVTVTSDLLEAGAKFGLTAPICAEAAVRGQQVVNKGVCFPPRNGLRL